MTEGNEQGMLTMQDFNLCGVAVYYVALATQPGLVRSR